MNLIPKNNLRRKGYSEVEIFNKYPQEIPEWASNGDGYGDGDGYGYGYGSGDGSGSGSGSGSGYGYGDGSGSGEDDCGNIYNDYF